MPMSANREHSSRLFFDDGERNRPQKPKRELKQHSRKAHDFVSNALCSRVMAKV